MVFSAMNTARNILENISALVARVTGILVVFLCVCLVGSLLISIFFRYVVGQALSWPEEISLIIFTWLVLLTGSLGVREEFHVKLTLFSSRLPQLHRSRNGHPGRNRTIRPDSGIQRL